MTSSPRANYVIEGLSSATRPAYCRAALTAVLKACPAINGVTLRIHGESGVAEGSYDFWQSVFDGVVQCGRRVEIDLHAKGVDDKMIVNLALPNNRAADQYFTRNTGLNTWDWDICRRPFARWRCRRVMNETVASFRSALDRAGFSVTATATCSPRIAAMACCTGVWPGTLQRLLLWGNPSMAADYGRSSASFCGSLGVEWFEPLSFKGRKGSGLPGGRDAYADSSLQTDSPDFEKHLYSYRVWGRHIYDPACDPDEWRRCLRKEFGRGATAAINALSESSQILPLITTAHCPSAANNDYWPEMYTNMSIMDALHPGSYTDTMSPKRFGTVSPLDPEFFSRVDDFADELLDGKSTGKYSPTRVAAALESFATTAAKSLTEASGKIKNRQGPEFRRLKADVLIQNGLGRFFAAKMRAGVLFAIYQRTEYRAALEQALNAYRQARSAWAEFAEGAKSVYRADVTFGPGNFQRGHWLDRLPAIDKDIAEMDKLLQNPADIGTAPPAIDQATVKKAIATVLHKPAEARWKDLPDFHLPPKSFSRGQPLWIETTTGKSAAKLESLRLHFRHVNQSEYWQVSEMEDVGNKYRAQISADYTNSPNPLQYYFELHESEKGSRLWPGLMNWRGQPYFVVRQA